MQTHALAAQPVQCGTNKSEIVSPHCQGETTLIQAIRIIDAINNHLSRPKHWIELMNAKLIRRGRAIVPTLKD